MGRNLGETAWGKTERHMERLTFKRDQIKWKHLGNNKDRHNSHKFKRCFIVKLNIAFLTCKNLLMK
jgi:hypothetical protein